MTKVSWHYIAPGKPQQRLAAQEFRGPLQPRCLFFLHFWALAGLAASASISAGANAILVPGRILSVRGDSVPKALNLGKIGQSGSDMKVTVLRHAAAEWQDELNFKSQSREDTSY
jgi:hypothetical protein